MLRIDSTHPMDEYLDLLRSSDKIFIDRNRLMRAVKNACYTADDYKGLTTLELRIESDGTYQQLTPDNIISFLCDIGVDLDKRYANRRTKSYSLDMKKVVDPLIADGVQVELLTAYKQYRSFKTYASFLKTLASKQTVHSHTSDGRAILVYDTTIQERENLRVYYRDIAVVSIPKSYSSIITGPSEEYHIAWCDYPQADWRFAYNLFIKDESNVNIMRSCEDTYEGLARLVEGDKFNPEVFKESRKQYKVSCLSTFYNSRDKHPIPTAMREYFRSRSKYSRYIYDLYLLQKFKLPVPITSYFGHTQLIPEASYPDAFISKGLNTPIQTFTSHIVNETVISILNRFWDLGYSKEDINVYYVRHDEPLFLFKDTILKDAWIFQDCSQIHIDGFTPIKLDFHFGNYYQEEDEYLTNEVLRQASAHPEKIQYYDIGETKDYYPIPSVESVYVQYFPRRDGDSIIGTDVRYYDYRRNCSVHYFTEEVTIDGALYDTLPQMINHLNRPSYLLVYNEGVTVELDSMDVTNGEGEATLLKIISSYDDRVAASSYA